MKHAISVLLALCLVVGMLLPASAVGYEPAGGISDHNTNYTLTLYVGEYWSQYFGSSSTEAYSLTGTLPNGLTWEYTDSRQDSARIYGTPTRAGQFTYTVSYEIESSYSLDVYHDTYYVTVTERHVDDRSSEDIIAFKDRPLNQSLCIDVHGGQLTDVKLTQSHLPAGVSWQKLTSSVRLLGTPTVTGYYAPSVFYSSREDGTFNSHTVSIYVCDTPDETGDTLVIQQNQSVNYYLDMDSHGTEAVLVELTDGQLPDGMSWSWGAPGVHVSGAAAKAGTCTVKFLMIRDDYSSELHTLTIRVLAADCGGDPAICPGANFTDMPPYGSWAHNPIDWAVSNGITNGVDATHFGPTANCMRAQVVTFLWRAAGQPEPTTTTNPFVDVKESDFYYKPVLWAVEKGITSGMDATHFGPFAECNRAQVVTFLWRMAGSPKASGSNPFEDVPAGSFFEAPVLWAVANGITNGIDAAHFGPGNVCNRAQVVTFLYRTLAN